MKAAAAARKSLEQCFSEEMFLAVGLWLNLYSVGWVGGQKPGTETQVTGAGWTMLGGQLVQTADFTAGQAEPPRRD